MSRKAEVFAADGHRLDAWRSDPVGKPKGGVIVLHAIYGLTAHMGDVCDQWAGAGYAAVAPALYDRLGRPSPVHGYEAGAAAGRACYARLTEEQVLADILGCAAALDGAGAKIVSGFCTGGTYAWVAAAKLTFDAQVNFYGSHVARKLDLEPRCPTVMHYGDADTVVPMEDVERIGAAHPGITLHVYRGGKHAFFNPEQGNYHAANAAAAWANSLAFLDTALNQ
ncbi:MAG: dienelactone hydrolase family protein [Hyphomicrobiaceae bacterium]